jgi:hypothetical protein
MIKELLVLVLVLPCIKEHASGTRGGKVLVKCKYCGLLSLRLLLVALLLVALLLVGLTLQAAEWVQRT